MKKAINSKCHGLNNQNNQSMNRQGIKMIANRVENGQLGEKTLFLLRSMQSQAICIKQIQIAVLGALKHGLQRCPYLV